MCMTSYGFSKHILLTMSVQVGGWLNPLRRLSILSMQKHLRDKIVIVDTDHWAVHVW